MQYPRTSSRRARLPRDRTIHRLRVGRPLLHLALAHPRLPSVQASPTPRPDVRNDCLEVPLLHTQRRRPQIHAHSSAAANGPPISRPHMTGPSEVTTPAPTANISLAELAGNLVQVSVEWRGPAVADVEPIDPRPQGNGDVVHSRPLPVKRSKGQFGNRRLWPQKDPSDSSQGDQCDQERD